MKVKKLTSPLVKNIKNDANHQVFYFDESLPRFLLCVYKSGKKAFMIKYQNKYGMQKWFKIGNYPIITLDEARKKASDLLNMVDNGADPAATKKKDKNAKTVSELCDWYLEDGVGHKKPSTIMNDRSTVNRQIKPLIGDVPLENLTRVDVIEMMNDIAKGDKIRADVKSDKLRGLGRVRGGKASAVRAVRTLGAILEFAKNDGLIYENPAHGIKNKPKIAPRDVFLTFEDIETLGIILGSPDLQCLYKNEINAVKMLLLTGCRKNEILGLKWDYIDFENQVFRLPDTKTGAQIRPFGKGVLNLLIELKTDSKSEFVFPSQIGKGTMVNLLRVFKRLCEMTDENGERIFTKGNVNLHSLRHTFASMGGAMGYSDTLVASLLGHHLGTITSRYTHTLDNTIIQVADSISQKIESALVMGANKGVKIKTPQYKRV